MANIIFTDKRGKETVTQFELWSDGGWTRKSYHVKSGKVYDEVEIPEEAVSLEIREKQLRQ